MLSSIISSKKPEYIYVSIFFMMMTHLTILSIPFMRIRVNLADS